MDLKVAVACTVSGIIFSEFQGAMMVTGIYS